MPKIKKKTDGFPPQHQSLKRHCKPNFHSPRQVNDFAPDLIPKCQPVFCKPFIKQKQKRKKKKERKKEKKGKEKRNKENLTGVQDDKF